MTTTRPLLLALLLFTGCGVALPPAAERPIYSGFDTWRYPGTI